LALFDGFAPDLAEPVYAPEDPACADTGNLGPFVDGSLRPGGGRDCADMLSFADEIGDNPMFLPNLEVLSSQTDRFGPPESASNQQRQDGAVALAAGGFQGRRLQQCSRLIDSQPSANPDAQALRAFDTPDTRSQFGAQEAGVGGFVSKSPHRGQAHVNCGGSEIVLFQEEPVPEHDSPAKCQTWLRGARSDHPWSDRR
jgi:hypothetical protein